MYITGTLLQVFHEKPKSGRGRLGSWTKDQKKEIVRQVFLFTNHMLLTTRASNGRLHLAKLGSLVSILWLYYGYMEIGRKRNRDHVIV